MCQALCAGRTLGTYANETAPVRQIVAKVGLIVLARMYFHNELDQFIAALDAAAQRPGAAMDWFADMADGRYDAAAALTPRPRTAVTSSAAASNSPAPAESLASSVKP